MDETIDLRLLAVFVALAEAESFTGAARRLGTTKATVSRNLHRLEEQLDAELVHRTTRKVALSTAGVALYERTAAQLQTLKQAVRSLPEKEEAPSGVLRITAPVDVTVLLLSDLLTRFTLRYPMVTIDLRVENRNVDLVKEGFDVAFRAVSTRLVDSSLTMRRLGGAGEGALYAAPSYIERRGSPKKLGEPNHEWIVFRPLRSALPPATKPRFITDDFLAARELLRSGAGLGILPRFVAEPYHLAGELVRVLPLPRLRLATFALLYPSSGTVPRKVTAFCNFVQESLKAKPL